LTLASTQTLDVPLRIQTIERDGSLMLALEGELDIVSSHLLDEALVHARASDAETILVDLLKVSFIDSTGLHVLIKHAAAEAGPPRIYLTKGSPQTQRLFELTRAYDYLPFVASDTGVNEIKPERGLKHEDP
jgi:anti-anti-sigma factor